MLASFYYCVVHRLDEWDLRRPFLFETRTDAERFCEHFGISTDKIRKVS